MFSFLVRRLLQGIFVLFAVICITFGLEHFVPGGPAVIALGRRANEASIKIYNHQHGLDRPFLLQLFSYLGQVIHLNLGYSIIQHAPVWYLLKSALAHTVMLLSVALTFQFAMAIPLGSLQAQRRNTHFDYAATGVAFVLYATPVFLIGQVLIAVFAIRLHLFPVNVDPASGVFTIILNPVQYILPVLTLSALGIGGLSRYQRSSLLDTLTQDYIRTAKAKGLPHRLVIRRHALRNSMLPIITIIGLSLPTVVGGALITETLYGIPGMGLLTLNSALQQDMPVVIGATIVAATVTVIGSIVADVLYALADPRIRLSADGK